MYFQTGPPQPHGSHVHWPSGWRRRARVPHHIFLAASEACFCVCCGHLTKTEPCALPAQCPCGARTEVGRGHWLRGGGEAGRGNLFGFWERGEIAWHRSGREKAGKVVLDIDCDRGDQVQPDNPDEELVRDDSDNDSLR